MDDGDDIIRLYKYMHMCKHKIYTYMCVDPVLGAEEGRDSLRLSPREAEGRVCIDTCLHA